MKRLTVSFALVVGLFLAGIPAAGAPQQVTLLHVNDTHSHLAASGPRDANLDGTVGGLPKAAAIVAREKAANTGALFVHAGDFMDGDLFFTEFHGVPELILLQSIGLDALVLGNHEFAFKPAFLQAVLNAAWPGGGGVPILGTNLDLDGYPPLGAWIVPTHLVASNGVNVGLFGITTASGPLAKPAPVVIEPDYAGVAAAAVSTLQAAGAQVIVCVSHAGMSVARQLAETVPGIDVIVNGHDNAVLEEPEAIARPGGGTTFIVSAGNHYRWVGRLRLNVNAGEVTLVDYSLFGVDGTVTPLPSVQAAIDDLEAPIVQRYGDVYHLALASAGQGVANEWNPDKSKRDTPLGNLFTDAYRAWTNTDIAFEAAGYLGDALPAGPVVGADIFRSMSYCSLVSSTSTVVRPWRLVTFRSYGSALVGVLKKLVQLGGDYFPQISGMRFDYDSSLDPSNLILLDSVRVGEDRLVPGTLYSVTVTEGVFSALTKALGLVVQDVVTLPDLAFDAARTLAALRGDIGPAATNRIRDVAVIHDR